MRISINIPSYKRPEGVETLRLIPSARVWVCESEAKEYRKANPKAKIIGVKKGIQGNKCRISNHILDTEFKAGAGAVCLIDDDISGFEYFEENKRVKLKPKDIRPFIVRYTRLAKEWGVYLWGVNLNQDKQSYREYTPFSCLSPIGGPFSVHIKNPLRYDVRFPTKDDYDISLQHLNKFRRVLRVNKYHYIARQAGSGSGQTGGCAPFRNVANEMKQIEGLIRKWGSRIVQYDENPRSHNTKKIRNFDINPVVRVPIRGV